VEWLLILAGGGGAVWAGRHLWDRKIDRDVARDELAGVRRLAEEDITQLGEELGRCEAEISRLDEQGRVDYRKALDAYEAAQRAVPRLRSAEEVSKITDTLSQGRYALSCVRARVAGEPVPEWRTPCFFNPQHGPSVCDVSFRISGAIRQVPACAQDAARVEDGERPDVRTVRVGSRTVPYWRAGSVYLPYAEGYFVGTAVVATSFLGGAPFFTDAGAVGTFGGGDFGGAGGFEGGGFDGGGFEGGGGFDGGFDGGGGF
jgi:hypothetical protein